MKQLYSNKDVLKKNHSKFIALIKGTRTLPSPSGISQMLSGHTIDEIEDCMRELEGHSIPHLIHVEVH